MEFNKKLDNSLRHLLETSSFTEENSSLGPISGHELGIMFKASWLFLNLPESTNSKIDSRRGLVKYMSTYKKTYVCFGHLVLTKKIWSEMPHELEVVKRLTKILHSQPRLTIESIQDAIDKDKIVKTRLRDKTSTQEFLRLYSDYFLVQENGGVMATLKSHVWEHFEGNPTMKVSSLVGIELIQSFIVQTKKESKSHPINVPKLYAYLHSLGYFVNSSDLQNFLIRFYQRSKISTWETPPQLIDSGFVLFLFEYETIKMISDSLKRWPITLTMIEKEVNNQGVLLDQTKLRCLIGTHFPDFKIKNDVVLRDHEPYIGLIKSILTKKCPLFIMELQNDLIGRGITLSRKLLSEVIVKSLDEYFIHHGQICLLSSNTSLEKLMSSFVLQELHNFLEGQKFPIVIEDLVLQLAAKGTCMTSEKLKNMIMEQSNGYVCDGNLVFRDEGRLQTIDHSLAPPQLEDELEACLKSLRLNSAKPVSKTKEKRYCGTDTGNYEMVWF